MFRFGRSFFTVLFSPDAGDGDGSDAGPESVSEETLAEQYAALGKDDEEDGADTETDDAETPADDDAGEASDAGDDDEQVDPADDEPAEDDADTAEVVDVVVETSADAEVFNFDAFQTKEYQAALGPLGPEHRAATASVEQAQAALAAATQAQADLEKALTKKEEDGDFVTNADFDAKLDAREARKSAEAALKAAEGRRAAVDAKVNEAQKQADYNVAAWSLFHENKATMGEFKAEYAELVKKRATHADPEITLLLLHGMRAKAGKPAASGGAPVIDAKAAEQAALRAEVRRKNGARVRTAAGSSAGRTGETARGSAAEREAERKYKAAMEDN